MRIKLNSKTKRNKFIYGELLENKKADSLVIFLSGFSGGKNSKLFSDFSRRFYQRGFSTLRLDFFNQRKDTLSADDMRFSVYIKELKNILDNLSKKYSKLIFIGHSFGAIIFILFLNRYRKFLEKCELILWDPSLLPWNKKIMESLFIFNENKGVYINTLSGEIMNPIFYKECMVTKTALLFGSLNKESLIIAAENSADADAKKYFEKIRNKRKSKLSIVPHAGHYFNGKKAQNCLFNKTLDFLIDKIKIRLLEKRG